MQSQTGFLLSFLKYGESDAVLHCYTQEKGFQSFFVKGIYAPRSKKKAYLLPLNELCFSYAKPCKAGQMQRVSQIDLVENPDLYGDVKSSSIVFFIADFLNQQLRNEEKSDDYYAEILYFLNELEHKNYSSHLVFLFRTIQWLGFSPLESQGLYLNPETGLFSNETSHVLFDESISDLWKNLIKAEKPYSIQIPTQFRKKFLNSVLVFLHFHLPDFRTPQSLEIVQQIFEN
ncbi:MAG: recombination protein O N-terminal domain-containing protein [Bacteroidetes bacterium]|nr:recombination protein O N-terminal domain-containing protein [Bacteroidota bacterium]